MKQTITVKSLIAATTASFLFATFPLLSEAASNAVNTSPYSKNPTKTAANNIGSANTSTLKLYGWYPAVKAKNNPANHSAAALSMASIAKAIPGPATIPERIMPDAQVVNTLDASGYNTVFLELEKDGEKFWVASTRQNIKTGTRVRFSADKAIRLVNFKSKSLNRTFDSIYFVTEVAVVQ